MRRRLFVWATPMLLLVTFLLTYQWSMFQYGDAAKSSRTYHHPITNVDVTHSQGILHITQTIEQLNEQAYKLEFPSNARDISCQYNENETCLIEKREGNQWVTVRKDEPLKFQYYLNTAGKNIVLSNWFIQLSEQDAMLPYDMNVNFTEKQNPSVQWSAPANLEADIKKEYIRYYQWEKNKTTSFPLLQFQPQEYTQIIANDLYIVKNGDFNLSVESIQKEWKDSMFTGPYVLVLNHSLKDQTGNDYMIRSNANLSTIKAGWMQSYLTSNYKIPEDQTWLIQIVQQVFEPREDVPEKVKFAADEITSVLSSEQIKLMKNEIFSSGKRVDPLDETLNHVLQKVYGHPTPYFEELKQNSKETPPLYFIDTSSLYKNDKPLNVEWSPIFLNNERFFPIAGIAQQFNMELVALPTESMYIIRRGGESWRLYLNKKTFVHNEENFGVAAEVLTKFKGEVFIQEKFIEDLWGISVKDVSSSIYLQE
ncbi:hypothetical protein [Pontibacillus yanchengensis]|uniref:Copper amine oxidase-like N-terminal domain-containing protein n=1 Tax=Pontibacillus yanchengensis Y32 TaxID=1385514 RepID=A0A0A2TEE4_9BACI|nr:hypothetical protein [Pontibacillus yanchengensis]KGP72461.1 hypothetical protein N782_05985 [Pontibacillus yanchengensis Y32]